MSIQSKIQVVFKAGWSAWYFSVWLESYNSFKRVFMANMETKAWSINFRWIYLTFTWNFLFDIIPDHMFLPWSIKGKRATLTQNQPKHVWKFWWVFLGCICRVSPALLMSVVSISKSVFLQNVGQRIFKMLGFKLFFFPLGFGAFATHFIYQQLCSH